ncbi:amidohydrolase [Herbiconiux sp. KACC 21604]|uniref:amidohydrolase n=1 Tax=unclassified Herbiconiux TaxID=2618217 RepID=UPI0014924047|nr:amidohydrolase [Herbiconiux sp. SALV-R1]QJU53465.1 amidohydrolase [Herbiconiux sp. SALV-R1]WPO88437.1 amidohydrolase [Herbiconiux sp. KACC 21604]
MKLDVVMRNGRIHTGDRARPEAHTIGILNGRVVGFDDELHGMHGIVEHDLDGQNVVPGFHDAHQHLSYLGLRQLQLDAHHSKVRTLDELYAAIERLASTLGPDEWILGGGFDQTRLGAFPHIDGLDRAAGGRPLWLTHTSEHMGVVNSEGLRRVGFADGSELPEVPGGIVDRDASGRFTGLLQEQAKDLVASHLKPPPAEYLIRALEAGTTLGLSQGLTSITEPGIGSVTGLGNGPADLHWFQSAKEQGRLGLRVCVMPYITQVHDLGMIEPGLRGQGLDLGLRSGFGDEFLHIGAVKVLSDGALFGRSAAMSCDFHDTPGNRGLFQFDPGELRETVIGLNRAGWQVAMHAVGDLAVAEAIETYALAALDHPRADARHRIEHCTVTSPADVARIAELGIVPVPQGTHLSEGGESILAGLGPELAHSAYRMRSFVDAGVVLPGSTDAPVVGGAPIRSIHDMVNRMAPSGVVVGPDERLTVEQAVRAYTHGSAYADHREHEKGTLSLGKLADLVVLSDDIFSVPADRICDVEVGATIVGGEVRFDAGALRSGVLQPS